jgi:DNA processing protein
LSLGVIVTEAAINSGSLIIARLAAEKGREVFGVPGFVKEAISRGTNALLKEGAALIEPAQDVIDAVMPQRDRRFACACNLLESRTSAAISWAKRNSWCMMPCRMSR